MIVEIYASKISTLSERKTNWQEKFMRTSHDRRRRSFALTPEAHSQFMQARTAWWKNQPESDNGNNPLTDIILVEELGLDDQTVSKIRRNQRVQPDTWRKAFKLVGLAFDLEQHCDLDIAIVEPLPSRLPKCIGRDAETQAVIDLLQSHPLVTLTGTFGIGKTRLAIEVKKTLAGQRKQEGSFTKEIFDLALGRLTDATQLPKEIAKSLRVPENSALTRLEALRQFLSKKPCLLILDNCEHLGQPCAEMIDGLSNECPELKILVTSREPLNLRMERIFPVPPLSLPDENSLAADDQELLQRVKESAAVELFEQYAKDSGVTMEITPENAGVLARICRRLDGIPWAIELVAPWAKSKRLEDLEKELAQSFQLLWGQKQDVLPHQQTLEATINWSYHALQTEETQPEPQKSKLQVLLARLAVFEDGWTEEAAENVCVFSPIQTKDIENSLRILTAKNLLMTEWRNGMPRCRLLHMVRQFARQKLNEELGYQRFFKQHRDYFLTLAEAVEQERIDTGLTNGLRRLENEHANLQAAMELALDKTGDGKALRLCVALLAYWKTNGHYSEGREWCRRVLEREETQQDARKHARVLNGMGSLAYQQGDYANAHKHCAAALALIRNLEDASSTDDQKLIARVLSNLALVATAQGAHKEANAVLQDSLQIWKKFPEEETWDDKEGIATTWLNLGNAAYSQEAFDFALECYEQCLKIWKGMGSKEGIAFASNGLGLISYFQRKYPEAQAYFQDCVTFWESRKDRRSLAYSRNNLALALIEQGNTCAAWELLKESLRILRRLDDKAGILEALESFALLAAKQQEFQRAVCLWSVATWLREKINSQMPSHADEKYRQALTHLRGELGDEEYEAAWTKGKRMLQEDAIKFALENPPADSL